MKVQEVFGVEMEGYLRILEPSGVPEWMKDYLTAPEMQRLKDVSTTCGTTYTKSRGTYYAMDTYEHSLAVALVIWHFTKDQRQALAGLFHDIATPVFKHTVDFMNGDYMTQESTEELTTEIIASSPEIMALLARDGIDVCEVDDYHLYPIADNDTPRLSADRLEYTLGHMLFSYHLVSLEEVGEFYRDIKVVKNEEGQDELSFGTQEVAERFIEKQLGLSWVFRDEVTRFSDQFLADVLKGMIEEGVFSTRDLYQMGEGEVMAMIEASEYGGCFAQWMEAEKVELYDEKPAEVYAVKCPAKVRWVDPLVAGKGRLSAISPLAKEGMEKNFGRRMDQWMSLGFCLPA